MDPAKITTQDATTLLTPLIAPDTQKRSDYLEGRWLAPEGQEDQLTYWTGPMLPAGHEEYAAMKTALVKAVAADNLPQSCIETYLDAVEGLEDWRLIPEGQDAPPEEPTDDERALTAYLDRTNAAGLHYRAGLTLAAHARTVLRPALSPKARDETGAIRRARDLTEALSRVHWQAPGWPRGNRMVNLETAGVALDPDTLDPVSVLKYTARVEGRDVPALEVSWVDDDGLTNLRVMRDGDTNADPVRLNLGGRLMLLQAELHRPIITRSMLGAVDAYVVASTMLNRNTHYAGFVERWAVGVQPPGEWVLPDGTTSPDYQPGATWQSIPQRTGPGMMNFYQPGSTIETVVENGVTREVERPTPAQVGRWEPVNPEAIKAALDHWRKAIRAEARQSFLELSDSTDASGRSREVAAGDYLRSAERLKDALTALERDRLELTLHLAALQLSDTDAARLRGYRVSINSRVNAFPVSEAARQVLLQEWQAGLIDQETALTESGRDDAEAIMARAQLEAQARQAQAVQIAQGGGEDDSGDDAEV